MGFLNFSDKKYNSLDKKVVAAFNNIRPKEKRKYLCHAPFKSMTFFHTGDILACWYNKLFPLGRYPEDSVHDTWFGNRAETLRKHILHRDLSYGCADCRRNFDDGNFYSAGAWRYDYLPEASGKYPVSVDFQITNSCNLQCIMCSGEYSANVRIHRENKKIFSNPYDDEFFRQIAEFIPHIKEASFSGGEPFFAPQFFRVYDLIKELNPGIKCSVTTNGNLLNEKIRGYLNALKFNISVSLDAITEDTYKKIRINGDFNTVLTNIREFSDYTVKNGTSFQVKICPMQQNWRELPELSRYLCDKNIPLLYNTVFYPPYCSLWNLRAAKLEEIISFLKKYHMPEKTEIHKQNALRYGDLIRQLVSWNREAVAREEWKLEEMTLSQLKDFFIDKIKHYLSTNFGGLKTESSVRIQEITELVERLILDSPSENAARMGLQYFAMAPVERLLAELEIRDYEKNRDRFLQIDLMK